MNKLIYVIVFLVVLFVTGCASNPNYNRAHVYDDGGEALMNYSSRMLSPGYGMQPARMQTQCLQQGPWLNCW